MSLVPVHREPHNGKILVYGVLLTDEEALALADQLRAVVERRDTARFLERCKSPLLGAA